MRWGLLSVKHRQQALIFWGQPEWNPWLPAGNYTTRLCVLYVPTGLGYNIHRNQK